MKHTKKRLTALLAALLLASLALPAFALTPAQAKDQVLNYLAQNVKTPGLGSEWPVLALARGGAGDARTYWGYYADVENAVKGKNAKLNANRSTENSRLILALAAIGKDAENVSGVNLVAPLADMEWVAKQGLNGPVFALLALDAGGYGTPEQRGGLLGVILDNEKPGGGWALAPLAEAPDMTASVDVTAMVLQALAGYQSDENAAAAIERALDWLSDTQNGDGGFGYDEARASVESTAQAVIALTALGVDPMADARFAGPGGNPVGALLAYQLANGGFEHALTGGDADAVSTEQAALALVAYDRFTQGAPGLYAITDAEDLTIGGEPTEDEEEEEDEEVENETYHWTEALLTWALALGGLGVAGAVILAVTGAAIVAIALIAVGVLWGLGLL